MTSRSTSSLLASMLVLAQLVTGPFAHAAPFADDDCGPIGQSTHETTSAMTDCGDCPDWQALTPSGSSGSDHHCRTHDVCTCPFAHTPALGANRLLVASPTPAEGVVSILQEPAFDFPLFDFLRPPN